MEANINIKIRGYQHDDKPIKAIQRKMQVLLKQIPFNSRVHLDFEYKEKTFYGKLKVEAVGKTFIATDKAGMLDSLTSSLCKKAQKQIMRWKKSRTLEEITGVTDLKKITRWEDKKLFTKAG